MRYFDEFVSNTLAGSGNQYFFRRDDADSPSTGRLYYKVFGGGAYRYSFLFSNVIDSTFADGSVSRCNMYCDAWDIISVSASVCADIGNVTNAVPVTFSGQRSKHVGVGELFFSDPVLLDAEAGNFICIEITFSGGMIPYHEETIIPTFVYRDGEWQSSKLMPFPCMIGCDRTVRESIVFLGDSITQGIGTPVNSYLHWNALLADMLGDGFAYWNIGLGFARAADAASDGAWLYKAKQADTAVVCLGANDIGYGSSEDEIKNSLLTIVTKLKGSVRRVVVQTIPPFDYRGDAIRVWNNVNEYILNELSGMCDMVFDVVPVLGQADMPHMAKYGGHPNADGCRAWAQALYPCIKQLLDE